jgi:hypothetical protein
LISLRNRFRDDLFEYQIFSTAQAQAQFRAQWKLEDYLTRIFDGKKAHPTLPYELTHFDPTDVKEGLKLFTDSKYHLKMCTTLAKLDFPDVLKWYSELFLLAELEEEQNQVVKSVSQHYHSNTIQILKQLKPPGTEGILDWLNALTDGVPEAAGEFKVFFESETYRALPPEHRVSALNSLHNYGLIVQSHREKQQMVGRILDSLLQHETSPEVIGRILRALDPSESLLKPQSSSSSRSSPKKEMSI